MPIHLEMMIPGKTLIITNLATPNIVFSIEHQRQGKDC